LHLINDRDAPAFSARLDDDWHHLIITADPMQANWSRKWSWDCDIDTLLRDLATSICKVTFNLEIPAWSNEMKDTHLNGFPTIAQTEMDKFVRCVLDTVEQKAIPFAEYGVATVKGYRCMCINWPEGVELDDWKISPPKKSGEVLARKSVVFKVVDEWCGTPSVVCTIKKPKVEKVRKLLLVERAMMEVRRALRRQT
jgi:hypothetical protein